MKYEKLADSIVNVLNGRHYDYKMYSGQDGKRTSNPFNARYFYVSNPNLMFIIDEDNNTLNISKSGITFKEFKPLLKLIKNITKRYFVNLNVHEYNKTFTPRDFTPDYHRQKHKVDRTIEESYHRKFNNLEETYYSNTGNIVEVKSTNDKTLIVCNDVSAYSLPYDQSDVTSYIVEHTLQKGEIDIDFAHKLYEGHDKFKTLNKKAKIGLLNKVENRLLKELSNYYSN